MKKMCILTVATVLSICSYSQTSVQRVNIKGGSSARENFMKEVYLYPAFEQGIVEYRNGKQYKGLLNYNRAIGTIEFLDEKNDTLALTDEGSIKSVAIGSSNFYFMPDCMQQLNDAGNVKLMKHERLRIADKQKIGGYGIANSTGTIESIDRIDTRISYNEMDINENLLLNKTSTFYLQTDKQELLPATKKNILAVYHEHDGAIRQFMKDKQIDLTKEDDLVELTAFLSKL